MHYHSNATTNQNQRIRIHASEMSYSYLSRQLAISRTTVHRWKHRDTPADRSSRPKTIHYAFMSEEQDVLLYLRSRHLSLDEVVDVAQTFIPAASRASVHRLFVRKGVSRLPKKEQQDTGHPGTFKDYAPGYLHIDCFYLPKLEGVLRYCFVAIDRATRLTYLGVYEHKDKEAATAFLKDCIDFYPFKLVKILTDNGREFTLKGFKNRYGGTKSVHTFDVICQKNNIEHRLTRPYTPKTNGMVERMNGLTKQNTTKRNTYETAEAMVRDLNAWFVRYNFCRKNRQIGKKTPYEATCNWFKKQPDIFIKKPEHLLLYHSQCSET
jgi:transposase-like protein